MHFYKNSLRLKDVYKRAFYSGGRGVAHERTSKTGTKGRTARQKNLSPPCGSPVCSTKFIWTLFSTIYETPNYLHFWLKVNIQHQSVLPKAQPFFFIYLEITGEKSVFTDSRKKLIWLFLMHKRVLLQFLLFKEDISCLLGGRLGSDDIMLKCVW